MMVGPSSGACFLGWDQDLNISRALAYKHILQVPVQSSWEIFYTDLISEQIFHSSTWGANISPMWPLWCQYFTGAHATAFCVVKKHNYTGQQYFTEEDFCEDKFSQKQSQAPRRQWQSSSYVEKSCVTTQFHRKEHNSRSQNLRSSTN